MNGFLVLCFITCACSSIVSSYSRPSHGIQRIHDKKVATLKAVGRAVKLCILGIILQGGCVPSSPLFHSDRTYKAGIVKHVVVLNLSGIYAQVLLLLCLVRCMRDAVFGCKG